MRSYIRADSPSAYWRMAMPARASMVNMLTLAVPLAAEVAAAMV
jgi:hypothetical protein